ncbi:MAG: hypothetical protein JOZ69_09510 [Myxococcales bacterium]|nr:hypothetical protein [Myxococcales bacterium]
MALRGSTNMARRHLPLLQTPASGGDPPRAAWQWVGFGAAAIFACWVPLTGIAVAFGARMQRAALGDARALARAAWLSLGLYTIVLSLGAVAGGYLVGRWGPASVRPRDAALAGLVAVGLVALVMWLSLGPSPGILALAALAPLMAALGGWLGTRGRGARP